MSYNNGINSNIAMSIRDARTTHGQYAQHILSLISSEGGENLPPSVTK